MVDDFEFCDILFIQIMVFRYNATKTQFDWKFREKFLSDYFLFLFGKFIIAKGYRSWFRIFRFPLHPDYDFLVKRENTIFTPRKYPIKYFFKFRKFQYNLRFCVVADSEFVVPLYPEYSLSGILRKYRN